ncbi:hypothetical protein PHJA_001054500 [Phtheirospermum japonicum]|uniref:WW domain-containing protein n=1 Tax=Phtheirospermum japonicum TaxID=374723 RepID=A0A830BVX0_9LAMI|nr:hypothetical protein PHJA_001054500 [Phtheirospermum japonicum]
MNNIPLSRISSELPDSASSVGQKIDGNDSNLQWLQAMNSAVAGVAGLLWAPVELSSDHLLSSILVVEFEIYQIISRMGRRKERRLAAISAAGRRVKLDLFAEPSGDVGGSSPQEEVGGDGESKSIAKLPSSPSSSGQQPGNPLLLLEQYSDDELNEGSSEGHNHAVIDDTSIDIDEEEKVASGKETEDSETNHDKEPIGQCMMDDGSASEEPSQNLERGSISETGFDELQQKQTNKMEETKSPDAPDEHPVGDVSPSWRMVLHEESNQYYYWNISTGETSWTVPDILAQANVLIEDTEGKTDAVIDTCKSSTPLDMEEGELNSRQLSADSMVNCQTSDGADQGTKPDGSNEDEEDSRDASQSNKTSLPVRHSVVSNGGAESTDLSSKLIKHCESLLKRLNSVKGLNCHLESQGLKMKCTAEIETRLADIEALASHGLSLLPFWLHSEGQIKRLEADVEGVIQCSNSSSLDEIEASLESGEGIGVYTEIGASTKKAWFTVVESLAEYPASKSNHEANNGGVTTPEQLPSAWYTSNYPVNDVGVTNEMAGTEHESKLASRPALPSGEDVDMDVDMEVDDTSSVESPHGGSFSVVPPSEEWIPPPPPDNEPFPPPPPDDEPFPPPPPDEPPESSYPPVSHLGSVQPLPYPEQYTLSYPGSNLEYYGQTNLEVPGSAPYMHPDGVQLAVSHIPNYYEAATNIYAVAPVLVNPLETTTYYGLQNGTLNPVSLISGVAESSGTTSEPVPVTLDSGTVGSVDYYPEAGSNLLPETNLSVVKSGDAMVKAGPSGVPETCFSTGAPATSSVANGVSVSSMSDTTTSVPAAAAATSKSQSKVPRSKKRTVAVVSTLRSNKKVSSLVDKWKAAKEELHEEEEEPEDTYEILERKRKREIEQWRAQQIASGEAKDNANFQPLGGDWRERVKRKRAQQMKESKQSSPDVATDVHQQADLLELSKGLPSGWQVYWDDSSKQVYYGNVRTSETTWTRPTD